MQTLVLGGARSGKSHYAELFAKRSGQEVVYVATARPQDDEMADRITHHRATRPTEWLTIEEPLSLAGVLLRHASSERVLLVDCLTLWLSNLLCSDEEGRLEKEIKAFFEILPGLSGHIIFVSNEVGQGIVPMGELSRRFVDEAGRLHQRLAAQAGHVVLMVAGLPMALKGELE